MRREWSRFDYIEIAGIVKLPERVTSYTFCRSFTPFDLCGIYLLLVYINISSSGVHTR